MLTLGTNHPPKNHEHLTLFLTSSEPLLKASNFENRTFKEWVQAKSKGSPPNQIQVRMNDEWKRISKVKRDLFEWLILFQPEL